MTTILVGTDTSASADLAVEDAAGLARARGAELLVLYVRPESDLRAVVDPGARADPDRLPRAHAERGSRASRSARAPSRATRPSRSATWPPRSVPTRSWSATGACTAPVAGARQRPEPGAAARAVLGVHRGHAEGTVTHGALADSVSRRNASTAITRRWTSGSSVRPSLWNSELMCFSTARSVRNSDFAIAALFLPCAICARTSRSRSVSWPSGECAIRSFAATSASTTFGSRTRAAARHLVERADQLVDLGDPLLQQVAEPGRAVLQQLVGVVLLDELGQHDDADVRVLGADPLRRVDALGACAVGGMRMSVSTASGRCSSTAASSSSRSAAVPTSSTSSTVAEQGRRPFPHEVVILGEDHPEGHARMVHAPARAGGAAA